MEEGEDEEESRKRQFNQLGTEPRLKKGMRTGLSPQFSYYDSGCEPRFILTSLLFENFNISEISRFFQGSFFFFGTMMVKENKQNIHSIRK